MNEQLIKLNAMKATLRVHETELSRLMTAKRKYEGTDKVTEVMATVVDLYKQFEADLKIYDEERKNAKIRFPLDRDEIEKAHPEYYRQSLQQLIREDGLPEELDSAQKLLVNQYGKAVVEEDIKEQSRGNLEESIELNKRPKEVQDSNTEDWFSRPILER